MNTTQDNFLQAVLTNPKDITTRLIFADWLEEQGNTKEAHIWRVFPTFPLTPQQIKEVERDLKALNRKRRTRTLSLSDCIYCAHKALIHGWYAVGGGTVANAYGYRAEQTVCFAAKKSNGWVRIQVDLQNATQGSSLTTPATGLPKNAKPELFRQWADQE